MESEVHRMSHALRGSLQGALLNLQALAVTLGNDAAAHETIAVVRGELLRAARMLLAAFEVLSLELGDVGRIDLRRLVARALERHGVEGIVLAPGAWPGVVGDEQLLALAIAHLARNARAATPPGARAPEIRAVPRGGRSVAVLVRDWGPGFGTASPLRRAFESSRRGHAASGLLMAERVARLHRGRLAFRSSSAGTVACLSLPAGHTPPDGPGRPAADFSGDGRAGRGRDSGRRATDRSARPGRRSSLPAASGRGRAPRSRPG